MDIEQIKRQANDILKNRYAECDYIEYKKSADQLPKILKTICAYGNNYYDNDIQFIFIGVEELNDDLAKAIPSVPISGIAEGNIEKCKNQINSLRSYLYPNVSFEVLTNNIEEEKYIIIVVPRQTGGPFMVSEKAEKDKRIGLKPGRYVRIKADSRLARVDEEYDLLRKFSNFHFSSLVNMDASLNDLNFDYLSEYVGKTSDRKFMSDLSKHDIARSLNLLDRNDPSESRVKNYAVLMFADKPENFVPYAYTELIIDMFGTKRRMESKCFSGPIWKQYYNVINYINDNYLSSYVLREEGRAENRKVENFPFVAIEELVANAIVHNNYENRKAIQIYISDKLINIVNYNKPLPPLKISDLNERRIFNERDTENPEIRDMFKNLGIIESFGTGIGEAKRAMEDNGSPGLYYKSFDDGANVTSVVIPVNEEYFYLKNGTRRETKINENLLSGIGIQPNSPVIMESEENMIKHKIIESGFSRKTKDNLIRIYSSLSDVTFGNSDIAKAIECSQTTATEYLKKLYSDLHLINRVYGEGKGKYCFYRP